MYRISLEIFSKMDRDRFTKRQASDFMQLQPTSASYQNSPLAPLPLTTLNAAGTSVPKARTWPAGKVA